ncbi:MAG: class I SAM-dependent methyltransferase [Candidatus Eremiobacteraeota bacterium]|nr:class I SAM-dependent methyltransferase [Candidatus Eremiobacteraeota bacterium]
MSPPSPAPVNPAAHPLAVALIERLKIGTVLELGTGSGRNLAALRAAGFAVKSIRSDRFTQIAADSSSFDAIISTHGLLHGNLQIVEATLSEIARVLRQDGLLYATFGAKSDSRFGSGIRIDADSFAPQAGDEAGVSHLFLNELQVRALLSAFTIETLTEASVDDVAGKWAHSQTPLSGSVHWFAVASRR